MSAITDRETSTAWLAVARTGWAQATITDVRSFRTASTTNGADKGIIARRGASRAKGEIAMAATKKPVTSDNATGTDQQSVLSATAAQWPSGPAANEPTAKPVKAKKKAAAKKQPVTVKPAQKAASKKKVSKKPAGQKKVAKKAALRKS